MVCARWQGIAYFVPMEYIDIHAHVNVASFKDDHDEVTLRALEEGVGMVNVGTQYDTSTRAVAMLETYPKGVYATVGLHPTHVANCYFDRDELEQSEYKEGGEVFDPAKYRELAGHERVVAIGECGLDYFQNPSEEDRKKQREAFEAQVAFANEVGKPLMLHLRNGKEGNVYKEACEVLKSTAKVRGNAHCFTGSLEDAKRFWELGYSTSFTGVITFTDMYHEVVRETPADLIHAETDAPYVAPVPHRGQRNEPVYVIEVVKKMAEIRGVSEDVLKEQLLRNFKEVLSITSSNSRK